MSWYNVQGRKHGLVEGRTEGKIQFHIENSRTNSNHACHHVPTRCHILWQTTLLRDSLEPRWRSNVRIIFMVTLTVPFIRNSFDLWRSAHWSVLFRLWKSPNSLLTGENDGCQEQQHQRGPHPRPTEGTALPVPDGGSVTHETLTYPRVLLACVSLVSNSTMGWSEGGRFGYSNEELASFPAPLPEKKSRSRNSARGRPEIFGYSLR